MKAIIWDRYGKADYLRVSDIEKPIPRDNEILIKIHATTVTAGDCEMRRLDFSLIFKILMRLYFGILRPKNRILGQELAGEVVAIGSKVSRFKVGDRVFASTGMKLSAYAQYICMAERPKDTALALMPSNFSYEEAACIPIGGMEALHFLDIASIEPGDKILINGAAGSIGSIAVQLAKYYGAEVTAVDEESKLDMLLDIGSDYVIDYKKEDFTKQDKSYDIIFDIVGKASFVDTLNLVTTNGCYIIGNSNISKKLLARTLRFKGRRRIIMGTADHKSERLIFLRNLIESGKIKAVVDKIFPLESIVDAHKYVEANLKKGNLVIKVDHDL